MPVQVCPSQSNGLASNSHYMIEPSVWIMCENLKGTFSRVLTTVWHGPLYPKHLYYIALCTMTREIVDRNISPSNSTFPPPDHGRAGLESLPAHRQHHERQGRDKASTSSQTAIFHAAAPPLIFAVLIAGFFVVLRMRLIPPPPSLPGIGASTVTVFGNTAAQRVLIWAEARWPGMWALPVLCAGALGVLRTVIWAGATVMDGLEGRESHFKLVLLTE